MFSTTLQKGFKISPLRGQSLHKNKKMQKGKWSNTKMIPPVFLHDSNGNNQSRVISGSITESALDACKCLWGETETQSG